QLVAEVVAVELQALVDVRDRHGDGVDHSKYSWVTHGSSCSTSCRTARTGQWASARVDWPCPPFAAGHVRGSVEWVPPGGGSSGPLTLGRALGNAAEQLVGSRTLAEP